jgi:hypothetical protein
MGPLDAWFASLPALEQIEKKSIDLLRGCNTTRGTPSLYLVVVNTFLGRTPDGGRRLGAKHGHLDCANLSALTFFLT